MCNYCWVVRYVEMSDNIIRTCLGGPGIKETSSKNTTSVVGKTHNFLMIAHCDLYGSVADAHVFDELLNVTFS